MTALQRASEEVYYSWMALDPVIKAKMYAISRIIDQLHTEVGDIDEMDYRKCVRCGCVQSEMCVGDLRHDWVPLDPDTEDVSEVEPGEGGSYDDPEIVEGEHIEEDTRDE